MPLFPTRALLAGLCAAATLIGVVCGLLDPAHPLAWFSFAGGFSAVGIVIALRAAAEPWR